MAICNQRLLLCIQKNYLVFASLVVKCSAATFVIKIIIVLVVYNRKFKIFLVSAKIGLWVNTFCFYQNKSIRIMHAVCVCYYIIWSAVIILKALENIVSCCMLYLKYSILLHSQSHDYRQKVTGGTAVRRANIIFHISQPRGNVKYMVSNFHCTLFK